MQNNVTELTNKLLRALDSTYNVIDMPAVIEIVSILEKITITKEELEATRLGKFVNHLRKSTTSESLARRTKSLLKKWRESVINEENGQLYRSNDSSQSLDDTIHRKRFAIEPLENVNTKRVRLNGQIGEMDLSDNSNSSFKDALASKLQKSVIIVNSDSNSSITDAKQEPLVIQQTPKKRGRKKGSKNHKNLIEEAETSFCNKLNVSRGNAKVKTTQELLADLQIRSSVAGSLTNSKPIEDLNERAAKLTERVSIIDQKLNANRDANSNRYKNFHKKINFRVNSVDKNESGFVNNAKNFSTLPKTSRIANLKAEQSEEIIIVDDQDVEEEVEVKKEEEEEEIVPEVVDIPKSLSIEDALALLPPVDRSVLQEEDPEPKCSCQLIENKTDFSIDEEDVNVEHTFEFVEDEECLAKEHLNTKYHLNSDLLEERVNLLHEKCLPNVNGNYGVGCCQEQAEMTEDGLYLNVVPNINTDSLLKINDINYEKPASENFKKYSISEGESNKYENSVAKNEDNGGELISNSDNRDIGDIQTKFCEWHQVLETPSYNGEILKILPYVIID